jgi:hypothetical protein
VLHQEAEDGDDAGEAEESEANEDAAAEEPGR